MEVGFWRLKGIISYKMYNSAKGLYLLFKDTVGPYYLINEKVLCLLKELLKPRRTEEIYKEIKRLGLSEEETMDTLITLEKGSIISYVSELPRDTCELVLYESNQIHKNHRKANFLLYFIFILEGAILIHLFYLIFGKFSLIISVRNSPTLEDFFFFFLFCFLFTLLHESGHAIAHLIFFKKLPKPFTVKPIGLFSFILVPRVNLNATYLLNSRIQRIIVLGSGLLVDIFIIWLCFLMVIITNQMPLWVYLTWFSFVSFLFNFLPLWSSDGYYILSEIVNLPNLKFYAQESLKRIIKRRKNYSIPLAFYGMLKIIFEIAIFIMLMIFYYKLSSLAGAIGRYAFWGIFILIFLVKFFQGLKRKQKGGKYEHP